VKFKGNIKYTSRILIGRAENYTGECNKQLIRKQQAIKPLTKAVPCAYYIKTLTQLF
jgi:hypothetical protein